MVRYLVEGETEGEVARHRRRGDRM